MGSKAKKLSKGDSIAVVSLSLGLLGEPFAAHELDLITSRLKNFEFEPVFMPNSLKGVEYLAAHPESRAEDLVAAFEDEKIKAIICAIGGDDTYRLAPYLFENDRLKQAVEKHPKIFLGFSDTTVNHLMLHKCGLNTFYGQALLPDVAELGEDMLPYTKKCFEDLFVRGSIDSVTSSSVWYDERTAFGPEQLSIPRTVHEETHGFEVLCGSGDFSGKILGGCIESMSDMLTGDRYAEEKGVVEKYGLFPSLDRWRGKILLLESSEERPTPEKVREMLTVFKRFGIFDVVSGVIAGKPIDEKYYDEYKTVYSQVVDNGISVVYNINVGHAAPRCIIPFGVDAEVRGREGKILIKESVLL